MSHAQRNTRAAHTAQNKWCFTSGKGAKQANLLQYRHVCRLVYRRAFPTCMRTCLPTCAQKCSPTCVHGHDYRRGARHLPLLATIAELSRCREVERPHARACVCTGAQPSGHNYIGHNHIGHNYVGRVFAQEPSPQAITI